MKQLLIAIDQALNCCIFIKGDGFGMADEALSTQLFRRHLQDLLGKSFYLTVDALFFFDPNHCYEIWRSEIERNQLPNHYRGDICQ